MNHPRVHPITTTKPSARTAVVYTGRVQGVGFRFTARHIARGFAVTGWVRNEPDASVRLEAQGCPAEVERFLAAIISQQARHVHNVESMQVRELDGESSFEIQS